VQDGDRDGYVNPNSISLGMFLDLGGTADNYDYTNASRTNIGNNSAWRQTEPSGAGWDSNLDFGYGFDSE
jgi:hypothetical protein